MVCHRSQAEPEFLFLARNTEQGKGEPDSSKFRGKAAAAKLVQLTKLRNASEG